MDEITKVKGIVFLVEEDSKNVKLGYCKG